MVTIMVYVDDTIILSNKLDGIDWNKSEPIQINGFGASSLLLEAFLFCVRKPTCYGLKKFRFNLFLISLE